MSIVGEMGQSFLQQRKDWQNEIIGLSSSRCLQWQSSRWIKPIVNCWNLYAFRVPAERL